jgi:adenylate cyclase
VPPESEEQSPVEIGHVLMLDVVGYSKRLLDAQRQVMAELNGVVRGTVRFRVAQAAGKLVSLPAGDGLVLVFFGEADAALESAIEITTALKAHPDIGVRMGIHSGPVHRIRDVNQASNIAGAGIDMAQRVMDCGDAGHILLSRRVAYDLAPLPRWSSDLYEIGECEIKHGQKISLVNFHNAEVGNPALPGKVKQSQEQAAARERRAARSGHIKIATTTAIVLALAAATAFVVHRRFATIGPPAPALPPPEKSIAVLPFVDLSQARDQEYFCDGISQELLEALAKTNGLRVVARTSSFSFKGKSDDVSEIGRKLNVSTLLEGSLRRDGNRVRITAELVNARDGFPIWSETYERELQGVFALQDEITRAIVEALKVKLAVALPARAAQNTEAYDLYLQGLFFSNRSTEQDLRKSLDFFEAALAKDPTLGRAWTGIAKTWSWLADAYVKPLEAHPKSQAAARKALAIDEHDAEAHVYLGETKRILDYDMKGEQLELRRALEIDPNSAPAHLFLALWQTSEGNLEEGIKEIHSALRLDPLSPIIGNISVVIYLANDRFDDAMAEAKRTMEIDPNYVYFEPNLALVYREEGKLREALDIYVRLQQTSHKPTAGLAITYARLGQTAQARQALLQLIQIANETYFPGEEIAAVWGALGEKEEAFRWLDRAIKEHSGAIHGIGFKRDLEPLHSDPRFADCLRRIGLDPAKKSHPK